MIKMINVVSDTYPNIQFTTDIPNSNPKLDY